MLDFLVMVIQFTLNTSWIILIFNKNIFKTECCLNALYLYTYLHFKDSKAWNLHVSKQLWKLKKNNCLCMWQLSRSPCMLLCTGFELCLHSAYNDKVHISMSYAFRYEHIYFMHISVCTVLLTQFFFLFLTIFAVSSPKQYNKLKKSTALKTLDSKPGKYLCLAKRKKKQKNITWKIIKYNCVDNSGIVLCINIQ